MATIKASDLEAAADVDIVPVAGELPGVPDGTPVAVGFVGELLGTESSTDTNIQTYRETATTGLSSGYGGLVGIVLTPGVWLVTAHASVTGSNPQTDFILGTSTSGFCNSQRNKGDNHSVSFCVPITVSTTDTVIMYGKVNSGSVSSSTQEIFAVRIA